MQLIVVLIKTKVCSLWEKKTFFSECIPVGETFLELSVKVKLFQAFCTQKK